MGQHPGFCALGPETHAKPPFQGILILMGCFRVVHFVLKGRLMRFLASFILILGLWNPSGFAADEPIWKGLPLSWIPVPEKIVEALIAKDPRAEKFWGDEALPYYKSHADEVVDLVEVSRHWPAELSRYFGELKATESVSTMKDEAFKALLIFGRVVEEIYHGDEKFRTNWWNFVESRTDLNARWIQLDPMYEKRTLSFALPLIQKGILPARATVEQLAAMNVANRQAQTVENPEDLAQILRERISAVQAELTSAQEEEILRFGLEFRKLEYKKERDKKWNADLRHAVFQNSPWALLAAGLFVLGHRMPNPRWAGDFARPISFYIDQMIDDANCPQEWKELTRDDRITRAQELVKSPKTKLPAQSGRAFRQALKPARQLQAKLTKLETRFKKRFSDEAWQRFKPELDQYLKFGAERARLFREANPEFMKTLQEGNFHSPRAFKAELDELSIRQPKTWINDGRLFEKRLKESREQIAERVNPRPASNLSLRERYNLRKNQRIITKALENLRTPDSFFSGLGFGEVKAGENFSAVFPGETCTRHLSNLSTRKLVRTGLRIASMGPLFFPARSAIILGKKANEPLENAFKENEKTTAVRTQRELEAVSFREAHTESLSAALSRELAAMNEARTREDKNSKPIRMAAAMNPTGLQINPEDGSLILSDDYEADSGKLPFSYFLFYVDRPSVAAAKAGILVRFKEVWSNEADPLSSDAVLRDKLGIKSAPKKIGWQFDSAVSLENIPENRLNGVFQRSEDGRKFEIDLDRLPALFDAGTPVWTDH